MDAFSASVLLAGVCVGLSLYALLSCAKPKNFPPGPQWFPIVGSLPLIYYLHAKVGFYHSVWKELYERYGPLVGQKLGGSRVVICSGYEAVSQVYNSAVCDGRPDGLYFRLRTYEERLCVGFVDGELWSKSRSFIVKNLRELGNGSLDKIIGDEAILFSDWLMQKCQNDNKSFRPSDVAFIFRMSALNCQWVMIAGRRFDLDDPRMNRLERLVTKFFQSADFSGGLLNHLPWVRYVIPEMSGFNKMLEIVTEMREFFEEVVEEHIANFNGNEAEQSNLIDCFIAEMKKTEEHDLVFNKKQLVSILIDLFMAGSETASAVMGFMLQHLVQFPETQLKIQEEIDSVIGGRRVFKEDAENLPYTRAFLTESQRFSNVVTTPVPHRTTSDFQILGYNIPKDSNLLLNMQSVHMDESHWGDPHVFRPERFLSADKSMFVQNNWFIPFGLGRRRCFGENIAKSIIFTFIVTVLQNFSVSAIPGHEDVSLSPLPPIDGVVLMPSAFMGEIKIRDCKL